MTREELNALIPETICPDGCSDCCTESWNFKYVEETGYIEQFKTHELKFECPRFTGSGCSDYENRPFFCRIVFKCESFPVCPRGIETPRLSIKEMQELVKTHFELEEQE